MTEKPVENKRTDVSKNEYDTSEHVNTNIKFHYIKSAVFRTIYVNGGYGGITPTGEIHLSVYSERLPIPRMTEHELLPDGSIGDMTDDLKKDGIVREMEVDLIMNHHSAVALRDWLSAKIENLQELMKQGQVK